MSDLEVVDVVRCLDGERRILVERDGSVLVYSLFEPAEVGSFGVLREIEGRMMGRADTRRREGASEVDYDAALQWLLSQRRRAVAQIFVHCRELNRRALSGRRVGVFRARGQVRFVGSRSLCLKQALLQRTFQRASRTEATSVVPHGEAV